MSAAVDEKRLAFTPLADRQWIPAGPHLGPHRRLQVRHEDRGSHALAAHVADREDDAPLAAIDEIEIVAAHREARLIGGEEGIALPRHRLDREQSALDLGRLRQLALVGPAEDRVFEEPLALDVPGGDVAERGEQPQLIAIELLEGGEGVDVEDADRLRVDDQGDAHHRASALDDQALGAEETRILLRIEREHRIQGFDHPTHDGATHVHAGLAPGSMEGDARPKLRRGAFHEQETGAVGLGKHGEELAHDLGQHVVEGAGGDDRVRHLLEEGEERLGVGPLGEIRYEQRARALRRRLVGDDGGGVDPAAERHVGERDVGSATELERDVAELDLVALGDAGGRLNPLAVDHDPIPAAEILDEKALGGALDRGVQPRHGRIMNGDVVLRTAPDPHLIALQLFFACRPDRRRDLDRDHR